jgi:hypothetical protein
MNRNYLNRTVIILLSTLLGIYNGFSQTKPLPSKGIISTKIIALKYESQIDTLKIPVVSDKYPALKKALSEKNIFDGDDLAAVIKNYKSCGCGTTGLSYEVTYVSKDIISIIFYYQTMGAYPDDYQKYLTFNINKGEIYPISSEVNSKGLTWLLAGYKTELRKRILQLKEDNTADNADAYTELNTTIDSLTSDELFKNCVFKKEGIVLTIEKILPHVMQDTEPERDWLVPYSKLKIYKAPGAIVLNGRK